MTKADKPFLFLTLTLLLVGFFIFTSASLGLLAREEINFALVAGKQLVLGILLGLLAMTVVSKIHYSNWNKYSLYFFIFAIFLTLLVFVPGINFEHGGAKRWIDLKFMTFQPSEVLKIAFVVYFASWLSGVKNKIGEFKYGLGPFLGFLGLIGGILLLQPDTDTFAVIAAAGLVMYFVSGAKWRDIGVIILAGIIGLGVLVLSRPYLMARIMTFMNPVSDPLGSGYQIQQSQIAIGSGGIFGRGFGKSLQKFNYLPEPVGDSIFAVFAEEWGLVGSIALILLFVLFALRGLKIASRAPNMFSALTVTGFITIMISQSFVNIASMLGVIPLAGMPLVFISQGGTAMLFALIGIGIILNISKFQKSAS